jgi:hypothetical protein
VAFFILFFIPVIIALGTFVVLHQRITLTELAIQLAVVAVIVGISISFIYHQNVDDTQVLNGKVTGKHRQTVPCSHSYSCDCHTVTYMCSKGSGKNQHMGTCTRTECDTCYEHHRWSRKVRGHDYNWIITSTLRSFRVNRVDRQGAIEPARYSISNVGDPVAVTSDYENYIKAAPDTLFQRHGLVKKFTGQFPEYPLRIYDYHYMDRLVGNFSPSHALYWQKELNRLNSRLQKRKANVVVVLLRGKPQEYAYALEQQWVGGKKNDVIVLINTNDSGKSISWTYIMSWTKKELFKIELRDHINAVGSVDLAHIFAIIERDTLASFEHRSMKDFEYLKSSIVPTAGQWTWSLVISIIVSIGLSVFFSQPDVHISINDFKPRQRDESEW